MSKPRKPWKQRYAEHLSSLYWRELKEKVIRRRGHKCESCGCTACSLDLHHKHYQTFGRERQKDVSLLCRNCHLQEDKARALRGRISLALHRLDRGVESRADIDLLSENAWRKA